MLDFSQRRELSLHGEVAADVVSALDAMGIPGIVVGAFARDLHLHYGAGIPVQRGTQDIDFAFAVRRWDEFDALRKRLLDSGAFRIVAGKQHRLRHRNEIAVDLVPFGAIETNDRKIAWPPTSDAVMDVFGFQESVATAEQALLPGTVNISIVCLSALALLKIVAWQDRHLRFPGKDAADLMLISRNYLSAGSNSERLWNEFREWTDALDFDYEHAGARMLGHDIRRLVDDKGLLKVTEILSQQVAENSLGELLREMDRRAPEQARVLLRSLYRGLTSEGVE